jgi:TonB family protein
MFCGNKSQLLTRRRQSTALFVSVFFHVLALFVLLTVESFRLAELDASFREVAFIAYPMNFDDMQPIGIKERDTAATSPKKSIQDGTISKQEKPQPPAPEPPPAPLSTEDNGEQPLPAAMPSTPEQASIIHKFEESELTKGSIPSPFGLPGNGSTFGWGGQGSAGGMGSSGSGSEKTGMASGGELSGRAGGNGKAERIIGANDGPSLIKMSPPVYPKYARRMAKEGKVVLSLLIDESGRLIEARVIEKAGHGFDEAALEAVRLWIFKPAFENGIPVSCRARMAIRFQLKHDM